MADTTPSVRQAAPGTARLPVPAAAAVLLLLTVSLRLPSLFEPPYYGDEGVFAATAQRLLDGETLYRGAWDDKPPGVFAVYAALLAVAGPSVPALRLTAVLWAAATALIVLAIGRRAGGEAAAWLAALLFVVAASLPLIEGNLLLTEALLALPAAAAVLLALAASAEAGGRRDRRLLAAGALLGLAFLFKQVAALDAAAVGLWLLCRRGRPWRDAALLGAGWLAPVALALLWLAGTGAAGDGLHAVAGFYSTYLREGSAAPPALRLLRWTPALLATALLLLRRRRGAVDALDLIALWFALATLGATLAGRPFGHYLVQVVAPWALLTAASVPPLLSGVPPALRVARLALILLAFLVIVPTFRGFWFSHPTLTPEYYANWAAWVAGRRSRAEHDRFYSWRVPNQSALVRAVERDPEWRAARPGERTLFVWGEYPWLYPLADARNPTRYSTSYLTSFLPEAKPEVLHALAARPPRFIVQELEEWRRLPGLEAFLRDHYQPVARIDNTVLWRAIARGEE